MMPHLHLAPPPGEQTPTAGLPIRVVLAEDHPLMRSSLRLLLDHEAGFQVIAEAASLAAAARAVERLRPHVLVLDRGMPDGSSVELIATLRSRVPQTRIVVLTLERNPAFARGALAAGATGFVVEELADAELPRAIRAAARDEQYVSPCVADRLRLSARRARSADGQAGAC